MYEIDVVANLDRRVNLVERFDFTLEGEDLVDLKSQVLVRINDLIKRLDVKGKYVHCDMTIQKDDEWLDTDVLAIALTEKGAEVEN